MKLKRETAVLVVVDMQQKLMPVIGDSETVIRNVERLIRGCHVLGVPILTTEQYVRGLGSTVPVLRTALDETDSIQPIEKVCFSSAGCEEFATALASSGRSQVILCGVEAHVCVYQTAIDLLDLGHEVFLVADATGSRTIENRETARRRLMYEGAKLTSTEMALFEMTVNAGTDEFRAISKLVK